jgi:hypothetical protein
MRIGEGARVMALWDTLYYAFGATQVITFRSTADARSSEEARCLR